MRTTIKVDNLKCGGCANSIHKGICSLQGVFGAHIDLDANEVTVDHTEEVSREALADKLYEMGYPEQGTVKGIEALKTGAKSFVSCAIGRFGNNK